MHKTLSFLFVSLFLVSCGKSGGGSSSGSAPAASVGDSMALEEISASTPVPSAALNFDVNIELHNFNTEQEDKVLEAADLIRKVLASEEFKNRILNHKVNGKKTFVDNDGLSNEEIYKKIVEGSEKLRPGTDNQMDLELEVYKENNSTVGYTYPDTVRVWMNEKFFNANASWKVTTNMTHEWLHKLGFKHDKARTPLRKYSVPYAIGYLMAELAKSV